MDINSDDMPGTKANPMPGATREEIEEAQRQWAAADPMTQQQRNERAGLVRRPMDRETASRTLARACVVRMGVMGDEFTDLALLANGGSLSILDTYALLGALAERHAGLAAAAEDDDAEAIRTVKCLVAADHAARITLAKTPVEIDTLYLDGMGRLGDVEIRAWDRL